jgi:hypothetical protein
MKNKIDMINHIPIKQVCEANIILIKNVQIWVDQKMLKNPMKKKKKFQRTKVKKLGSPRNERVEKTKLII